MNRRNVEITSPFKNGILNGNVAIITGGGSGINFGIAEALAEHGCKIAIMGRRQEVLDKAVSSLKQKYRVDAVGVRGDVRNYEDCQKAIEDTKRCFGTIDILVNGAAGNFLCKAEDLSPNGFKTVVSIDLIGTFHMCRAAFDTLKNNPNGSLIVNVSATLGYTATPLQIHASAAKMGVEALTRSLASEWGEFGIRSVAIAPGPVKNTEGMSRLTPPGYEDLVATTIPLGRLGESYEIGLITVFLATSAGSWISGDTIIADGGQFLSGKGGLFSRHIELPKRTPKL